MFVAIKYTTKHIERYPIPEYKGKSAIFWLTIVVLTFKVPVEKPIAPPNRIIATPQIESSPNAKDIITITGAKAINIFTPWVVHINPNTKVRIGMNIPIWWENFFASFAITVWRASLLVSIWNAPPENSITNKRSTFLIKASTIYIGIFIGFTGVFLI